MSEGVITTEQLAVKDREIMTLRTVLHYYADPDNYERQLLVDTLSISTSTMIEPVLLDKGLRAKKVMETT